LLLRAQQCEYEFSMDSHAAALRHLERALAIGPSYAPAMALAAFCHAERRVHSWMQDPEVEARDALRLASRAVELGKDDPNIFWMAGYAVLRLQMDALRARELVRHSLDINPNSAIASVLPAHCTLPERFGAAYGITSSAPSKNALARQDRALSR
jgi:tetratricopeptide (TPR) repeat protein